MIWYNNNNRFLSKNCWIDRVCGVILYIDVIYIVIIMIILDKLCYVFLLVVYKLGLKI